MAIPLFPLCLVVTKRAVAFHFPGGMPAFQQQYGQRMRGDEFLVVVDVTNGGLHETLEELAAGGLYKGLRVAVAGDGGGVFGPVPPGIAFVNKPEPDGTPHWSAESSDVDITQERRSGRVTWRKPYPGETFLGGSGVIIPMRFDDPPKARAGGPSADPSMLSLMNAMEDAMLALVDQSMGAEDKPSGGDDDGPDRQG